MLFKVIDSKIHLCYTGNVIERHYKIKLSWGVFVNITQIKLENYTVFKNVEINFDKGINVFIGENGTGKHRS